MGTPPTIEYASLGMTDSLILMVMALVVFGPRKLPQIGRQIGKLMYEFRKASNDFKFQMEEELRNAEEADRRKQEEDRRRALELAAPPAPQTIEAQAGIGAVDPATASPYPGESTYPAQYPAETPAESPTADSAPKIQPPSTGEPVPAARPWSPPPQAVNAEPETASDSSESNTAAPAHADPAAAVEESNHG
ncbi:MAG: twin-arginine translocase TatA/TatE family subunit [Terracidiphilus sp.]|jgi:sec-independent protein translocase protein TatB